MSGPKDDAEKPITYAVRLSERAKRDIDFVTVYLADTVTERLAVNWRTGLNKAVGTLSLFPHRNAIIAENSLFSFPVRDLLYRRTTNSKAYRVLYRIKEEGEDGPQVTLIHVRLAERPPITAEEAREIEAQQ